MRESGIGRPRLDYFVHGSMGIIEEIGVEGSYPSNPNALSSTYSPVRSGVRFGSS